MEAFDPKLVSFALMSASLVKVVVDLVKMAAAVPQWVAPALALTLGIGFVLVIMVASSIEMTSAMYAQGIIAGVLSGGMSIGSTALQDRTKPSTDARTAVSVPAPDASDAGVPSATPRRRPRPTITDEDAV